MNEVLSVIWAERSELLVECWQDFVELAVEREFAIIVLLVMVIIAVGTGLSRSRFRWPAFGLAMLATCAALYLGIDRGEAGEVLFNGTLL